MPYYPSPSSSSGSSGPLATKTHNPGTELDAANATTTLADVEATSLAVTFTVPASGAVLVEASPWCVHGSGGDIKLGLREGTTDVVGATQKVATVNRPYYSAVISGLTPGAVKTWKLAFAAQSSGTAHVYAGGGSGPITIAVWDAAPTYTAALISGNVRPHKMFRRTAGDLTLSANAVWADLPTIGTTWDVTIPAVVGDVIEAGISGVADAANTTTFFDVVTIASAVAVNSFGSGAAVSDSNKGVTGWYCPLNLLSTLSGSVRYTVVSGDIVAGMVTVRLRNQNSTATTRNLHATADYPLQFWAENRGAAAA